MNNTQSLLEKNANTIKRAFDEHFHIWVEHILFTWRWWLGVAVIIICIGIWFWLRKRESADRLFYAGFFTAMVSSFLNSVGNFFGLWGQRYEVFPAFTYLPWVFFMLPTIIMLLLLFKPNIHPLFKALFLGALTSFVGLPLLDWLNIYEPTNWRFIYSFPIQMVIYLLAHFISRRRKFDLLQEAKKD